MIIYKNYIYCKNIVKLFIKQNRRNVYDYLQNYFRLINVIFIYRIEYYYFMNDSI
jgi:hypothetical protein